jgi:predicted nucleic acid-binding protein
MKPKVYIETTVVSYYTAWPSRDVVIAGHQQITREWWSQSLPRFDPAISELVMEEAGRGDPQAGKARFEALADFPILVPGNDAGLIADAMIEKGLIPREYINDALHISIAATNGIDYLLTWNCRHLANAIIQSSIRSLVESFGYACPVICTPEELMEELI